MSLRRDTEKARAFLDRGRESSARSLHESSRRAARNTAKRRAEKPSFNPFEHTCWFRRFDHDFECEGNLPVRCHMIKEQTLLAMGFSIAEAWHPDFWMPGCNGFGPEVGGHHFRFDNGLLKLDRRDLPARLERRASQDERIAAHLDRLYGALPKIGAAA